MKRSRSWCFREKVTVVRNSQRIDLLRDSAISGANDCHVQRVVAEARIHRALEMHQEFSQLRAALQLAELLDAREWSCI